MNDFSKPKLRIKRRRTFLRYANDTIGSQLGTPRGRFPFLVPEIWLDDIVTVCGGQQRSRTETL